MVFCCSEPLRCAKILTGGEIVVMSLDLIMNLIVMLLYLLEGWIFVIFIVIKFIILVCLCVEIIGIIKKNYGVATFSCVFRVLQVIAYVLWCIFFIFLFIWFGDDLFQRGGDESLLAVILFSLAILQLGYAIYRTVMQFKLKSMIKNGNGMEAIYSWGIIGFNNPLFMK